MPRSPALLAAQSGLVVLCVLQQAFLFVCRSFLKGVVGCVDGDKETAIKKKVVYARKKPAKKPAADAAAEEEAAKAAAAAAEAEAAAATLAEVMLCSCLQTLGHL